ncbi:WD40-repeat-containing domain protein [Pelagophyceae sp. CCMP2097]|nr:WD40-repeat-containing domain protein [Pelagophyceae sp. CCMP2097]
MARSFPRRLCAYAALGWGFDAMSIVQGGVLTARALRAVPFGAVVAACNLGLGPLVAVPFWIIGARPAPNWRVAAGPPDSVPSFWFVGGAALAIEAAVVCYFAHPRGVSVPVWLDWEALYHTAQGAVGEASAALTFSLSGAQGAAPQADALVDAARVSARFVYTDASTAHVLAAVLGLESFGAGAARGMSNFGAACACAAVSAAAYAAFAAADAAGPRTTSMFGAWQAIKAESLANVSPRLAEAAPLACALLLGVVGSVWALVAKSALPASPAADAQPGDDELRQAAPNVCGVLSFVGFLLLVPYAVVLQGPELHSWAAQLAPEAKTAAVRAIIFSAAAAHLARELQAHLARDLGPAACTTATALRRCAAVLALTLSDLLAPILRLAASTNALCVTKRVARAARGVAPAVRRLILEDRWKGRVLKGTAILKGHTGGVRSCAFSPDSKRIATASDDGTVRLWDAETKALLTTLEGHTFVVSCCAFSPNGTRITGALQVTLEGHTDGVTGCAFSPDGKRVATVSWDGTPRLWDAETGALLTTLEGHNGSVWCCAFSPDGKRIVTASRDGTARLWIAETGGLLLTLESHTTFVTSCAFPPDGERVVTASYNGTAQLWDAETGVLLTTLEGHTAPVWCCAFSPDCTRIVTASEDRTVRLWDAETAVLLRTLEGHTDVVECCSFSPNGERLVTASHDKTARLWDVSL